MIDALFDLFSEFVGTATAAIILPVLTFGAVRVDVGGRSKEVPWHGVRRTIDGKLAIDNGMAALIGLLFWAGVIGAGVWLWRGCPGAKC